jgi:hypothetical protein
MSGAGGRVRPQQARTERGRARRHPRRFSAWFGFSASESLEFDANDAEIAGPDTRRRRGSGATRARGRVVHRRDVT